MEHELLGNDVVHFPNLMVDCKKFIDFFEQTVSIAIPEWAPWMSGGDDHHDIEQYGEIKCVERKDIQLEKQLLREKIVEEIDRHDKAVVDAFIEYLKILGTSPKNVETIKTKIIGDRPPNFTLKKYHNNKSLGPHPDWGEPVPAVFTVAVYLNNNYDGGDLFFPDLGRSISLTEGSVVIFPSKFLHGSEEVDNGTKYLTNEIVFVDIELLDGRNVYA